VASVPLIAAGNVMFYLLPTRAPGKIVASTGFYIFSLALIVICISQTIHALRQKPEGTPQGLALSFHPRLALSFHPRLRAEWRA